MRRPAWTAFILVISGCAFHLPALEDAWRPSWDSAVYLTLARNLSEGHGYTYLGQEHLKYPPGLPLLLAPLSGGVGEPLLGERILMIVCALAFPLVVYFGARRRWGESVAFAAALCAGLNYGVLLHTVKVLSDVPFLVPWTLSLFLGEWMVRERSVRSMVCWSSAFTLAFSIRVVAICQLPLLLLFALRGWRAERGRRKRWALLSLATCLVPALWFARVQWHYESGEQNFRDLRTYEYELATGESYSADAGRTSLGDHWRVVVANADLYRGLFGAALTARGFGVRRMDQLESACDRIGWWIGLVVSTAFLGACWFGFWVRRSWIAASSLLYLLMVLAWPSYQGIRFLLPLYPALFLGFVAAIQRGTVALSVGRLGWLGAALGPLLVFSAHAFLAAQHVLGDASRRAPNWFAQTYGEEGRARTEGQRRFEEAGAYIKRALPGARVACDEASTLVYLFDIDARSFPIVSTAPIALNETGLRRLLKEREVLLRDLERRKVTHVCFVKSGRFTYRNLTLPLLAPAWFDPDHWQRIEKKYPSLAAALGAPGSNSLDAGRFDARDFVVAVGDLREP